MPPNLDRAPLGLAEVGEGGDLLACVAQYGCYGGSWGSSISAIASTWARTKGPVGWAKVTRSPQELGPEVALYQFEGSVTLHPEQTRVIDLLNVGLSPDHLHIFLSPLNFKYRDE